jgi:hypothetical protein
MKNHFFVAVVCLSLAGICRSRTIDTPYVVGTWHGFCAAAASFTFDDGCQHQFSIAVPMFNAKNLKGTFYTVVTGGMFPGWPKLQSAASNHHEIASHSMTHPTNLGTMSTTQQIYELKNSRDSIDLHIVGARCNNLAYPNCNPATDSLMKKYYYAGRICSGQVNAKTPADFNAISCFICGTTGSNNSPSALINLATNALGSNGWTVYLVHEIDSLDGHSHGGYSPTLQTAIQGWVNYMDTARTRFWVETFGNVVRYIRERDSASVRAVSRTTDSITFQVTDPLNDTLFNVPLSIRRPLPSGWMNVKVTQGTSTMTSQTKDSGAVRYVIFEAVPDRGNVIISRSGTGTQRALIQRPMADELKVSVTAGCLRVLVPSSAGPDLAISVYNPAGMKTARFKAQRKGERIVAVPLVSGGSGIRIISINDGMTVWSRQCLLQR